MLVCQTIAKHYTRLDLPSKSRASSGRGTGSQAQLKRNESSNKVPSEGLKDSQAELPEQEKEKEPEVVHQILNNPNIQRFIYDYILEKLKAEKLTIQVDPQFEEFLRNLKVPLELNQMRTMKEDNYNTFRDIIR
jgi:hypothetical protein